MYEEAQHFSAGESVCVAPIVVVMVIFSSKGTSHAFSRVCLVLRLPPPAIFSSVKIHQRYHTALHRSSRSQLFIFSALSTLRNTYAMVDVLSGSLRRCRIPRHGGVPTAQVTRYGNAVKRPPPSIGCLTMLMGCDKPILPTLTRSRLNPGPPLHPGLLLSYDNPPAVNTQGLASLLCLKPQWQPQFMRIVN